MTTNIHVKRGIFPLFLIVLVLFFSCPALAQKGEIKLLAVSESPAGLVGSVASLELDIQPGSGRVFIDTLPTSKIDTQLSTRFAKDMACKYLNLDCSNLDFFYTIRADSPIVGGPSAGAATTILTISLLDHINLEKDTVITGTINSGDLIGPVGGVKEKVDAAALAGLKRVLIPMGENSIEVNNKTVNMIDYGREKGIDVIEVGGVDDALYYYAGKNFSKLYEDVDINPMYKDTMRYLSDELCRRSSSLKKEVEDFRIKNVSIINVDFAESKKRADNLTTEGRKAFDEEAYYSAASYCFGASVRYNTLLLRLKDVSGEESLRIIAELENNIRSMDERLDNLEIKTITDLQAYMVVKDRLEEAGDYLNKSRIKANNNMSELPADLAFATERYYSAVSWANFLGQNGKKFRISEKELRESCFSKISEAEEQYNYINYLFRGILSDVVSDIQDAKDKYKDGHYELCLYKASLVKARIGIVSSSVGFKKEDMDNLLDRKLDAARKSIIQQQKNGIFHILGYSYYEYSSSLRERDVYSALLYAEYSLELVNMDIYFEPEKAKVAGIKSSDAMIFFSGIAIGIMLTLLIIFIEKRKSRVRLPTPHHKRIKFKFKNR